MKLSVAICDDEPIQIQYVSSAVQTWAAANTHLCKISSFPSAEAFLFEYSENKAFDVLLLDIEMGNIDGITLAKKIREQNHAIQIIFVTGYPNFIAEGYEVSALHYLIKPVSKEKIGEVMNRAAENIERQPERISFMTGGNPIFMDKYDILFAEAAAHNIVLHTVKGNYTLRMGIGEAEHLLGDGFFRCGRSFIVSLEHIARITKTTITLDDKTEVPLGKGLYGTLEQTLMESFRRP